LKGLEINHKERVFESNLSKNEQSRSGHGNADCGVVFIFQLGGGGFLHQHTCTVFKMRLRRLFWVGGACFFKN
jgi:hypothetical protein